MQTRTLESAVTSPGPADTETVLGSPATEYKELRAGRKHLKTVAEVFLILGAQL